MLDFPLQYFKLSCAPDDTALLFSLRRAIYQRMAKAYEKTARHKRLFLLTSTFLLVRIRTCGRNTGTVEQTGTKSVGSYARNLLTLAEITPPYNNVGLRVKPFITKTTFRIKALCRSHFSLDEHSLIIRRYGIEVSFT